MQIAHVAQVSASDRFRVAPVVRAGEVEEALLQ